VFSAGYGFLLQNKVSEDRYYWPLSAGSMTQLTFLINKMGTFKKIGKSKNS